MAAKRSNSRRTKAVNKTPRKKQGATRAKGASAAKPKAADASRVDAQIEQIQRVVAMMVATGAVEIELEEAGSKLRVRLKEDQPVVAVAAAEPRIAAAPLVDVPEVDPPPAAAPNEAAATPAAGETFKSPMVGTFYLASSPDVEPFVKVGDVVTEDSVLCIIEAMKVMNEIKAEMEGQVIEIVAQNGEPVDYGQPLFVIRT